LVEEEGTLEETIDHFRELNVKKRLILAVVNNVLAI
jgi:hypothetical protein